MERVLILGGSSNMGLATARLVAKKGYQVVIAGRNDEKLKAAQLSVKEHLETYQIDLTKDDETAKMFEDLHPLTHIVVTVSAPGSASSIFETDVTQAKSAYERFWINYRVLHHAKEYLRSGSSITLISGSSSKTPLKGYGFWGTMHGSIEALAKNAAIDLAPIRVNVVSPGGIGLQPDRQLLEHFGSPGDVAKMILAIIENPAVTNSKIDVDSGERQGEWSETRTTS